MTGPADPHAADRPNLVGRLKDVPERLAHAARHAPGGPIPDGEWGPADIVRHLIAVEEEVWHARFRQLAAEDNPHWPWAEPDRWQGEPEADLARLLAVYGEKRRWTIDHVEGLDDAGWRRLGTHATYGVLDVAAMLRILLDHDDEHLVSFEG